MNCFPCDGYDNECNLYQPPEYLDRCTYKYIADKDIKHFKEGNSHIILERMFVMYVNRLIEEDKAERDGKGPKTDTNRIKWQL